MRKKLFKAILLATCVSSAYAQNLPIPMTPPAGLPGMYAPTNPLEITKPSATQTENLVFNDILLGNLLTVLFNEVMNKNFVLSPRVLEENRPVSFRYSKSKDGSLDPFLTTFLKSLGYELSIKNGVYYVQDPAKKRPEEYDYLIYHPQYRDANYLINNVRSYFGDNFKAEVKSISSDQKITSNDVSPNSAAGLIDKAQDILTFRYETEKEKNKILNLIKQLDTEEDNLLVKAYIYEVNYSTSDGSAFGLILNLASSKLNLSMGSTTPLDNFAKLSSNALTLIFSNINTDNRFKLLSNPFLRVKNNKLSSFNVGASVPVLGSISYQGSSGTPIQEVKYIDTGLIFQLTPHIKKQGIDIDFISEISEVQNTTSGVNGTPTLTKRKLNSNFTTKRNEVVMLAGLTNNKNDNNTSIPFIFPFFKNKIETKNKTEIVVFLEVVPIEYNENKPQGEKK